MSVFSIINVYYNDEYEVPLEEKYGVETLAAVLMIFDSEGIKEYEKTVYALTGIGSYLYAPKKLDLDLRNHLDLPSKPSIEEPSVLQLKELPGHLRYAFLVVITPCRSLL